jgi:membrane-associated PAP2 superfamily phosphatase
MISNMLRIAIRLTFYLTTGVVFVLLMEHFHLVDDFPRWALGALAVVFALGMVDGRRRRLRRNSRTSRDAR